MKLDEILSKAGRYKPRKRVGRGGKRGKTSGRGHKGAGQRSGSGALYGYEGGQTPALARIPKRGFNNARFRTTYQTINVAALNVFDDGSEVNPQKLADRGLIHPGSEPVKILGDGTLKKKLAVSANAFSASAEKKIIEAGGSVERI